MVLALLNLLGGCKFYTDSVNSKFTTWQRNQKGIEDTETTMKGYTCTCIILLVSENYKVLKSDTLEHSLDKQNDKINI